MAISRAQLLKELLPGLNALFGMEYQRYGEEHKEIYETESVQKEVSKKKQNYQASQLPLIRLKVLQLRMTTHKKLGQQDTTTKPLL
jgi:hypothetical protein